MKNEILDQFKKIISNLDDEQQWELDYEIQNVEKVLKEKSERLLLFELTDEEFEIYMEERLKFAKELKRKINSLYGVTFDEVKDNE